MATGLVMEGYFVLATGVVVLVIILFLFWLKDALESPILARIAYSELIARLALAGAAFGAVGLLLIAGDLYKRFIG